MHAKLAVVEVDLTSPSFSKQNASRMQAEFHKITQGYVPVVPVVPPAQHPVGTS
jgi:hypothetical protein